MARIAALAALLLLALAPAPALAFENGRAPDSALSPAAQGGCVQLEREAARAWNTLQLRVGRILPANGCLSAYRSFAQQVELRRFWCARGKCQNAAVPGRSNHGLGRAIDVSPRTVVPVVDRSGAPFGWCKNAPRRGPPPCFSDAPHEPWHVRYSPGIFRGRVNPCPLREGDRDACVRGLERRLRAHGVFDRKPDATFGRFTRTAVLRFQASHRLAGDGIVGPATWKQLLRRPAPSGTPAPLPSSPGPGPIPDPPPKPTPSAVRRGVDVSIHQGNIDWQRVRGAGYRFAIAKSSEGQDFRDRTFSSERVRQIRAELGRVGSYHFLRPRAGRSGAVEARFYVRVSRAAGIDWRRGRDLRPVADTEVTTLPDPGTCRYLKQFVDEVKRLTGRRTLIYTFPAFANNHLRCSWIDGTTRLWIAHFKVAKPLIPFAWTRFGYSIWQHSSEGRVSGIAGNVDLNVTTSRALRALAAR
jgi:lysozyme